MSPLSHHIEKNAGRLVGVESRRYETAGQSGAELPNCLPVSQTEQRGKENMISSCFSYFFPLFPVEAVRGKLVGGNLV